MRRLLGVALLLAGVWCGCSADADEPAATADTTPPTVELAERWDPAMAVTADGIFVWGGSAGDGETPPLGEFQALYGDDGAIIDGPGRSGTAVAAYDPATTEWRAIDLPPELRGPAAWIWTTGATADGKVVVHVTKGEAPEVWILDLADERWTMLEEDSIWSSGECVVGDHLLRIASPTALTSFDLTSADPTAQPTVDLPAEQAFEPAYTMLTCTDDAAFVMSWSADVPIRRYDPTTGTWSLSSPPPAPSPDPRAFTQLTKHSWNGDEVLYLSVLDQNPGLAYRPATDTWRVTKPPIPAGVEVVPDQPLWTPDGVAIWTPDGIQFLDLDPD